jgi:hypothetical protein
MKQFIVRNIKNSEWYWASKKIMKEYASKIGVLALGIYHFLAYMADEQQSCFPSQRYIAKSLGCARSSVSTGIKKLRDHNLIAVDKSYPFRPVYKLLSIDGPKSGQGVTSGRTGGDRKTDINDIRITKINNKTSIGDSKKDTCEFPGDSKEEILAMEIAEALEDQEHLSIYLTFARKYSESFLKEILLEVKRVPLRKIKKSRGALFTFLVKRYKHD